MSETSWDDPDDGSQVPPPAQQQTEGSALRQQLEEQKAKNRELSNENKTLKLERGIDKAGLGELNEKQRKALVTLHEGDPTPEALLGTAVELGFAQPPPPPPEQVAAEGAERISQAAQGGQSQESSVITTADVAGWDRGKQRRFMAKHPDEFTLLMEAGAEGKVSGIAFN